MPPVSRRSLVAVLLLAVALVAGCSSEGVAPAGPTRVVSADNGEITVPVAPQRVVATGYAVPALIEADAPLVGTGMERYVARDSGVCVVARRGGVIDYVDAYAFSNRVAPVPLSASGFLYRATN